MALNNPSELSLPQQEDETPRSPRTVQAVALVGVPEITGEPDKIAAAIAVRERLLIEADEVLTELRSNEILTEEQADTAITPDIYVTRNQVQAAQMALNRLRHQQTADWWLAQQHQSAWTLLNDFIKEAQNETVNL